MPCIRQQGCLIGSCLAHRLLPIQARLITLAPFSIQAISITTDTPILLPPMAFARLAFSSIIAISRSPLRLCSQSPGGRYPKTLAPHLSPLAISMATETLTWSSPSMAPTIKDAKFSFFGVLVMEALCPGRLTEESSRPEVRPTRCLPALPTSIWMAGRMLSSVETMVPGRWTFSSRLQIKVFQLPIPIVPVRTPNILLSPTSMKMERPMSLWVLCITV